MPTSSGRACAGSSVKERGSRNAFRRGRTRATHETPADVSRAQASRARRRGYSADLADVRRLGSFRTLLHVELDLLALGQAAKSLRLDRGVMDEHVLAAAVRRDEPKSLRVVEPLHGPARHRTLLGPRLAPQSCT